MFMPPKDEPIPGTPHIAGEVSPPTKDDDGNVTILYTMRNMTASEVAEYIERAQGGGSKEDETRSTAQPN